MYICLCTCTYTDVSTPGELSKGIPPSIKQMSPKFALFLHDILINNKITLPEGLPIRKDRGMTPEVCVYVCVCACVCASHACTHAPTSTPTHAHTHIHVHTHTHTHTHTRTSTHTQVVIQSFSRAN